MIAAAGEAHLAEPPRAWSRRDRRLREVERRGAIGLPRHFGTWLIAGFALFTAAAGIVYGGHVPVVASALATTHHLVARGLGFGIDRITISGIAELTEDEVLATGSIDTRGSLPFLDAETLRSRIAALPLVSGVAVHKLYPADLVIKLTERKPFALWQNNGEIAVVSKDGVVIDAGFDARFVKFPLAVGEGANRRVGELAELLDAAGDLRASIRAGVLVAERRWNLKLVSGIDVKLPEERPADAVRRLENLQRKHRLIDRDVLVIDLRDPDRVTLRLTPEAAEKRREAIKAKYGKWKGSNT